MQIPDTMLYSNEHIWTKEVANGLWEAGITDYAQDLLGDIVFIDAPTVGTELFSGKPCGLVESVKTGSDLYAPVDGTVTEINEALANAPELVNEKPYHAWIFKYKPIVPGLTDKLLSAQAYKALINDL
jgi:glycine cleavage system H protein